MHIKSFFLGVGGYREGEDKGMRLDGGVVTEYRKIRRRKERRREERSE